jgi:hypothetical protein
LILGWIARRFASHESGAAFAVQTNPPPIQSAATWPTTYGFNTEDRGRVCAALIVQVLNAEAASRRRLFAFEGVALLLYAIRCTTQGKPNGPHRPRNWRV